MKCEHSLTDSEMNAKILEDIIFWKAVEDIARSVDNWPDWKKEGWAIIDKREKYNDLD
jgi:hypothetical protein